MNWLRWQSGVVRLALLAGTVMAGAGGCERELTVASGGGAGGSIGPGNGGTGAGGASGGGLTDGIDQNNPGAQPGGTAGAAGAGGSSGSAAGGNGPGGSAGAAGGRGGSGGAGATGGTGAGGGAGTSGSGTGGTPAPTAAIQDVQVMMDSLSTIQLPAVGTAGVSLLQYSASGLALVHRIDWNGGATTWHDTAGARFIYTAASGDRHLALLYTGTSYGIFTNGMASEISGNAGTYKEFLAANEDGFAWVDYVPAQMQMGGGRPPPGGPNSMPVGKIVFQRWMGARSLLTDSLRYRARLDLSRTHVAFVEYASTAAGSVGQVMVQPLAGGAAIAVAPGNRHQDRPAVDGDWVVWEEYPDGSSSVIRARNLSSGQVRDLSATTGFRTNPDIRGSRVIWEDQRSGNGDIYFADLADDRGERVAVSGPGHSAAGRLTADGVVWIETNGGKVGLVRARWSP